MKMSQPSETPHLSRIRLVPLTRICQLPSRLKVNDRITPNESMPRLPAAIARGSGGYVFAVTLA